MHAICVNLKVFLLTVYVHSSVINTFCNIVVLSNQLHNLLYPLRVDCGMFLYNQPNKIVQQYQLTLPWNNWINKLWFQWLIRWVSILCHLTFTAKAFRQSVISFNFNYSELELTGIKSYSTTLARMKWIFSKKTTAIFFSPRSSIKPFHWIFSTISLVDDYVNRKYYLQTFLPERPLT